jgi:hypothetical protein
MNDDKSEAIIIRLDIENIPPLWPQLAPLVEKSMIGTPVATTEDVFNMLMARQADGWVQLASTSNLTVQAFAVTDYDVYPQGVWLRAWLCATAPGFRLNAQLLRAKLHEWSKRQRCRGLVAVGRMGWTKIFPDAKVEALVLRITDA